MTLNAQTIALQLLSQTRQWTGNKEDPSLLDFDTLAIDQIIKQNYDRGPVKITRNATDRVTSILTWETNKLVDAVLMMELSLPHIAVQSGVNGKSVDGKQRRQPQFRFLYLSHASFLIHSIIDNNNTNEYECEKMSGKTQTKRKKIARKFFDPTGGTRRHVEYARFVHENGKKSTPFSSAAGVMIVQTVRGISKALMAATASGRERTVEGVANAILRMLLLEKGAGDAVEAIDAYVDQRDGRSHCSPKMNERLKLSFNYVCDSLAHRKPKRTVMAAERRSQAPHVTMALSQQYDDYNYASGF
ncbi:hypothetical protein Y032_0172g383 [Ancylostoma ceylanicum]|nr:hypothetical protein Y032_0172g383 [Ancylostoma ceylanicum]